MKLLGKNSYKSRKRSFFLSKDIERNDILGYKIDEKSMGYGDYPSLTGVKNVLVIKLRQLGDVLLSTPVFSALQTHLPEAQIDAYIYESGRALLEGHPAIRKVWGWDSHVKRKGFWHRYRAEGELLWRLRRERYDLVINLTEGDRGLTAAWVCGASIRVGFAPKNPRKGRFLTHVVKSCPTPRHRVEWNLDALRRIGIFPPFEERELFLKVPASARRFVQERIQPPFVLIHPVSRWQFKCWPIASMRSLAQKLIERGHRVVFTAGPGAQEMQYVEAVAQGLQALNLAGCTDLGQLGALVESAQGVICVDSLPFHMASVFQKPTIALWGPTSEKNWGPWRNPHARILAKPLSCRPCFLDGCGGSKRSDCLEAISVEEVLQCVEASFSPSKLKIFS